MHEFKVIILYAEVSMLISIIFFLKFICNYALINM